MKKVLITGVATGLVLEAVIMIPIWLEWTSGMAASNWAIQFVLLLGALTLLNWQDFHRAPRFLWRWGAAWLTLVLSDLFRQFLQLILNPDMIEGHFYVDRMFYLLTQLPIYLVLALVATAGWYLLQRRFR